MSNVQFWIYNIVIPFGIDLCLLHLSYYLFWFDIVSAVGSFIRIYVGTLRSEVKIRERKKLLLLSVSRAANDEHHSLHAAQQIMRKSNTYTTDYPVPTSFTINAVKNDHIVTLTEHVVRISPYACDDWVRRVHRQWNCNEANTALHNVHANSYSRCALQA